MEITSIDILVHPRYVQRRRGSRSHELRQIQIDVAERWDERVHELAQQRDAILLYFSTMRLGDEPIEKYITGELPVEERDNEDLERIKQYKNLLGERLFVFQGDWLPYGDMLYEAITSRGFSLSPYVEVRAYGELYDACVQAWGEVVVEELEIPRKRLVLNRDLSLSLIDRDRIWKEIDAIDPPVEVGIARPQRESLL